MQCPYRGECTVATALNDEYVIRKIIREQYCKKFKYEECERAKYIAAGKELPKNLLPDGKIFEFLNKKK